ncbi:GGDEF domain-containing protein [Gilvimarinus agarilyticus]|uniref:GGDEF domain-containing protein n=1 Tax=Gilvimarinus agarilyticus TaxID=679259 RepID=UPI0005A15241|nr:GGDEF domain-containing protein [Gilvimarinus agarilyticus]
MSPQRVPLTFPRWLLLASLLLTLAALFGHQYIPLRTLDLLPDTDATRFIYADSDAGGGTRVEWLDFEKNSMRCTREADKPSLYCGFNLALSDNFIDGIDISEYDHLKISMVVNSINPRLSIFMRNYNPAYSTPDDGNSAQYIIFNVRVEDINPELVIGLDEFRVADWWLEAREIQREYTKPEFNNITLIGANLGSDLAPGDHELEIRQMRLQGPWVSAERWYQLVIGVWLIIGFGYVLLQSAHYANQAKGSERRYQWLKSRHQQLRHQAENLKDMAQRDKLTGLLNRHGLELSLEAYAPDSGTPMAILLLDIDHFKRINDRRGHDQGDKVLIQVATVLTQNIRSGDLVARWGGEEFLIVAENIAPHEIYGLAEKIRTQIFATEYDASQSPLVVSASVGAVQWRTDESFEQSLHRADEHLYQAKALGRNCSVTDQPRQD